jgi:hypothetical protein
MELIIAVLDQGFNFLVLEENDISGEALFFKLFIVSVKY